MIYREATASDLTPQGISLVSEGLRELGTEEFSPERSIQTMLGMLDDPATLMVVADTGDELAGVLLGSVYDSMFSNTSYGTMHVWYVRAKYRGGWTGYRLARIYRDWARMVGADTVYFDVNSGVNNEMAGKIAQKLGFKRVGELYKWT